MKKIILAAFAIIGFSAASFAQTTQKTIEPATQKKEHKMTQPAKTVTPKTQASMTTATAPKATQTKQTTPVAANGPAKKDGTPDMRYKANKTAVAAAPSKHLKKDGTPDKRYTENKKKS
ncbi:hypothetical protein JMG10_07110 [Nostoc ellipsosporum NOK]|jgi:hypothetical protein|nr:hypothetical protein [Nostoc ellipsosporum NOK]